MRIDLIDRLWNDTKLVGNCWIWTGARVLTRGKRTYGYIHINRKIRLVHRLSVCIYQGLEYKDNWQACHTCNNQACWNPLHLYAGDSNTNANDRYKDMTHCKYGHERNETNTYINSQGNKMCKVCAKKYQAEYQRRYYAAHSRVH